MSWAWKGDDDWVPYSEEDQKKLETAFEKGQKTLKLNKTYKVDLKKMFQYRIDDPDRQRDIRREEQKGQKREKEEEEEVLPVKKQKQEAKPQEAKPQGVGVKRLQRDLKITKETQEKGELGLTVDLLGDDLYRWKITLSEFDPKSQLAKDLAQYEKKHGVNSVTLHLYFPNDYPLTAPLVHIVTPKLVGNYIFSGGLCMSTLMQGWAAGITPESLVLQIRQLFMEGNIRINNVNKEEFYSEAEARSGFNSAKSAHANDKNFE
eukprot:TRINITY_DN10230_c0_g1_i1.p1 TRINITY_DN10230_c0_g1~~TRINITY_DN10230_c0_g1_i1.p1  ORF type:complete len:262 (+),score=83.72 TRINITY_DN10230_c0_g1_i1:52-837(+)